MSFVVAVCAGWTSTARAQTPDLTITKTHVGNFTQSQNGATYTITVSNDGSGAVQSGNTVTVTDTVPTGLIATFITGTGWGCSQPSGPCTRISAAAALPAGQSYPPLTLTVNVAPDAPASLINSVTVSGGGEVNTANNTATDMTNIGPGPDLFITKTHVGNFTQSQNGATYTITVSNDGPGAVQAGNTVTVTDTLPPSGLTATFITGTGWGCSQPSGPCTRVSAAAALPAGQSYPVLTLTVNVAPDAPASVTNTVTVSGGGELNTANNMASNPTTIGPGPDLYITKTHDGNFTQSQNGATYTITVSNDGPGAVQAGNTVTVTDTLPTGLNATFITGTGWGCSQPSGPCTRVSAAAALPAGQSYPPLALTVNVAPDAPASVTNSVAVAGGGELNAVNNTATDMTTIGPGPDLIITKTHVGNFAQSQNGATYTITVSNIGLGAAQSGNTVTVTDAMPPSGLTATFINGTGWGCTQPSGPCTRTGAAAALPPGQNYPPLTLTVNVAPDAPASVTNTVSVSGGGELNAVNNTATDPTTIGPGPDLTIAKSHVGNFTQSQNGATYVITVTNEGPGPVQSGNTVTVTETMLPAGLTATSINGTGWNCSQPFGPCTRTSGNTVLGVGASYPSLTLTVNVAPDAPASLTNSVTVSGGGETNTANNTAMDPTTVGPGPDLTITKTHGADFTQSQNGATYTITVTNIGLGAAQAGNTVTVTDAMPSGLTATFINGTGWNCSQPSGPCSRTSTNTQLGVGASYPPLTLTVNVAPNAPPSLANTVTLTGGGEVNTTNNAASDMTTIGPGPDLTIAKSHVGNFTQGQNGATYTITVSNVGPGAAQSGNTVTVTEALPSGLTATFINGTGWLCTQPSGPCTRVSADTALAVATSYPPLTLTVNVGAGAPVMLTNSVTVSGGGEVNTANNAASDATTVIGATLDIDGSSTDTKYDALTDGLLVVRYMYGLTGAALTMGALGDTPTTRDATAVKAYLDLNHLSLDIDGDGNMDPATDGVLIVRYLFGLRGEALIEGAFVATAPRNTAMLIEDYLVLLTP